MTKTSRPARSDHSHRAAIGDLTADPKCERCGRPMSEIRAERAAYAAAAPVRAARQVDRRTIEERRIDSERRAERYRRTGR